MEENNMSYGSLQKHYGLTTATSTNPNTITTNTMTITSPTIYPTNYTMHLSPDTVGTIEFDYNFINKIIGKEENKSSNQIIDIVEYVPFKVYKIVFADKTEIKTIRNDFDSFNVEYMLCLALAKKLYSKDYTFDGILHKAWTIQYEKKYDKIVKRGVKLFNKLQEEKRKKEEYDEMKKRQYKKLIEKKKRAKERKRQEQVNIIADAIRLSKEEA